MPTELPVCRGEYGWSQSQPVDATLVVVLHLPHRCSLAVSFGRDARRQSLTLALAQSATGLNHLTLADVAHSGCAVEPDVTRDLFYCLLNTTVAVLQHHCPHQISLSGPVPEALLSGEHRIELPWEQWGFQRLAVPAPGYRRVLARVRNLKVATPAIHTNHFPVALGRDALQWIGA